MKRTLTIIFSLLMIMIAFMACEMIEDGDPLPPSTPSSVPAGTVKIKQNYSGTIAQNKYYVGNKIIKNHFDITLYGENGSFKTNSNISADELKCQIKYAGESTWEDIDFDTSTYKKAGVASIKAYKPSKETLAGTTTVEIYPTGPTSQ